MAYGDFKTLAKVAAAFDLELDEGKHLFLTTDPIRPSEHIARTLQENVPLANAINTEKARAELIIAPVLLEIRRLSQDQISFFSGVDFTVDPAAGLNGYCDYILSASSEILGTLSIPFHQ